MEHGHARLKGPLAIAPVFWKDTKKVTAYAYLVLMALWLWQLVFGPDPAADALRASTR